MKFLLSSVESELRKGFKSASEDALLRPPCSIHLQFPAQVCLISARWNKTNFLNLLLLWE